jgi:hypothetical protein
VQHRVIDILQVRPVLRHVLHCIIYQIFQNRVTANLIFPLKKNVTSQFLIIYHINFIHGQRDSIINFVIEVRRVPFYYLVKSRTK